MISVGGRAANFDVYIAHEQGESSFTGFGSFGGTVPSSRSHTYVYTVYTRFVPKNRIRVPNCNEIRGDAWFTRTTRTAHSATTNEASYRVAGPFFRRIAWDYRTIQKQPSSWISRCMKVRWEFDGVVTPRQSQAFPLKRFHVRQNAWNRREKQSCRVSRVRANERTVASGARFRVYWRAHFDKTSRSFPLFSNISRYTRAFRRGDTFLMQLGELVRGNVAWQRSLEPVLPDVSRFADWIL